jgi:iron(III) transport system ATP-binding protein
LREQMRSELRDLQRSLGLTMLYVTHDQAEALSMSDRIAVMDAGAIVQEGTPREIYDKPATHFVARFVGSANFVEGETEQSGSGYVDVATSFGVLRSATDASLARGRRVTLTFRPENIRVHADPPDRLNVVRGVVERLIFLGDQLECVLAVGSDTLLARLHPATPLESGQTVYAEIEPEACAVIDDQKSLTNEVPGEEPATDALPGDARMPRRVTLHEEVK